MKKSFIAGLACVLAFSLILTGCTPEKIQQSGGSGGAEGTVGSPSSLSELEYEGYGGALDSYANEAIVVSDVEPLSVPSTSAGDAGTSAVADARKVIYGTDYQLETTDMDAILLTLESAIKANGGFIEKSNYSGLENSNQFNRATLTCRIPVSSVDAFKEAVEAAGHVTAKTEVGRDVTDTYFDTEARVTVLQAEEARLLELLDVSGSLSDLLQVERELTRVRTEIELLQGSLKKFDNLIELATVAITIKNVSEYTPDEEKTFIEQLGEAAINSLRIALAVIQTLLIVLVYMLPYLVVAGAVVFIILWLRKRIRKTRRAKQLTMYPPLSQPQSNTAYPPPPEGNPTLIPTESKPEPPEANSDNQPPTVPDDGSPKEQA